MMYISAWKAHVMRSNECLARLFRLWVENDAKHPVLCACAKCRFMTDVRYMGMSKMSWAYAWQAQYARVGVSRITVPVYESPA